MRARAALGAEIGRTLRFAVVGSSVTLIYALGYAGLRGLGLAPWLASALAFATAIAWQYRAQTTWTFRAPSRAQGRVRRFGVTVAAGLVVASAITGWIGPATGLSEAGAVVGVILWVPAQNYLIFRFWVYRDAVRAPADRATR